MQSKSIVFVILCLSCSLADCQTRSVNGLNEKLLSSVKENDLEGTKQFIAQGADVNYRDTNQAPILMWAAYKADLEMIQYLVEQGADPTLKGAIYIDTSGAYYGNLLGIAAAEGRIDLIKYFLDSLQLRVDDRGWNPTGRTVNGNTALHWTATNNLVEATSILLQHGGNPTIENDKNQNAIELARLNTNSKLGVLLRNPSEAQDIYDIMSHKELLTIFFRHYNLGDYKHSIEIDSHYLASALNEFGEDSDEYNDALNNVAVVYNELSMFKEAAEYYETALQNTYSKYGSDHRLYRLTLNNIAWLNTTAGNYEEALHQFQSLCDDCTRPNVSAEIECGTYIYNFANLHQKTGNFEKARELYGKSLRIIESNVGTESLEYGICMLNFALLEEQSGNYEKAFIYYQRTEEILRTTLGTDHPKYGTLQNNIGELYRTLGQTERAQYFIESSIKTMGNQSNLNYAFALLASIPMYISKEKYEKAVSISEKGLSIIDNILPNTVYHGVALNLLGVSYSRSGDTNKAISCFNKACEIIEASIGIENHHYITSLNNIAYQYWLMNSSDTALHHLQKALKIKKRIDGKFNLDYFIMFSSQIALHISLGKVDDALKGFNKLSDIVQAFLNNQFQFLTIKERFTVFRFLEKYFNSYSSFSLLNYDSFNKNSKGLYNIILKRNGTLIQYELKQKELFTTLEDSVSSILYFQWSRTNEKINNHHSTVTEKSNEFYVDSLETLNNKLERQLLLKSKPFADLQESSHLEWQDVQAQLTPREIAIEFSHFDFYNKKWTDSILYVAYLLRKNSEYPEMVYLFEEKELNILAKEAAPNALYGSRGIDGLNRSNGVDKGEGDLYQIVWKNLEAYLDGIETIYFAPSGKLHQIAFAALSDSTGQLLSEKYQLVQMSSTGKLVVPDPEPKRAPALVMGGIQYEYDTTSTTPTDSFVQVYNPVNLAYQSTDATTRSNRGETWNYLNGSRKEARSLYRLYKGQKQAVTMVSQTEATEEYIKSLDGNSPKVLHLATHGFFFEDPEEKHQDIGFMGHQPVYTLADDPLMRSGLVLAGANYAWQHGQNPYEEEDGILTAYEISNLNLSNTDLVVLSACETGLGDIEGSEGVYGLQRAFRMAGVEYIIMSLWEVPDDETSEFMELFYKTWLGGESIYEAFSSTQREMATQYRNEPQKWAGFVLVQ